MRDLAQWIGFAVERARDAGVESPSEIGAAVIGAILQSGDWHIISNPTVTRSDEPPISDIQVMEAGRFSLEPPERVTTTRVELDGEIITARGTMSREVLYYANDSGYAEYADAQLGRDLLAMVGHRLGVLGCGDVPERLSKTGTAA